VHIERLQQDSITSNAHLPSIMLRQNELAYLKALSSAEMSPAIFRELRRILAAG
jgi:hypothetical protein